MKVKSILMAMSKGIFIALGLLIIHASNVCAQSPAADNSTQPQPPNNNSTPGNPGNSSTKPQAFYIGGENCKGCHPNEYKEYENYKYTKTWVVIKMRGKASDPQCLKCHATGYGKPGGFVSEAETPNLKGKQCESCHGPGSIHANDPGDPVARTTMKQYIKSNDICIQCHVCMKTHKSVDF